MLVTIACGVVLLLIAAVGFGLWRVVTAAADERVSGSDEGENADSCQSSEQSTGPLPDLGHTCKFPALTGVAYSARYFLCPECGTKYTVDFPDHPTRWVAPWCPRGEQREWECFKDLESWDEMAQKMGFASMRQYLDARTVGVK